MPENKAYATVTLLDNIGSPPSRVAVSYLILAPDNSAVVSATTTAFFNYGDSGEAIREAIAGAIRVEADDPGLDVEFVG
jgi:hypothetical protein